MDPAQRTFRQFGPIWQNVGLPYGGMTNVVHVRDIPADMFYEGLGIRFDQGVLKAAKGHTQVGSTLTGGAQIIERILSYAQNPETLVLTTQRLYKWDSVSEDWESLWQEFDSDTVTVTSGSKTVTKAAGTDWDTEINAGDLFYNLTRSPAYAKAYTIDTVDSAVQITLTANFAEASGAGHDYAVRHVYAGTHDTPATSCYGEAKWVFSNGIDPVKTYDTTTVADLAGASGYMASGTKHIAQIVRYYHNACLLFNTTEDGNRIYQRVRYSHAGNTGDITQWDAYDFNDLVDTPGEIMNAMQLGGVMAIYKSDCIVYMEPTGTIPVFSFRPPELGVGLIAPMTLCRIQDAHFFLGFAEGHGLNAFINTGSEIVPIGLPIQFDIQHAASRDYMRRAFSFWDATDRAVMLFVPSYDATANDLVWRYEVPTGNATNGRWMAVEWEMSCGGRSKRLDFVAYEDLVGAYEDQDWIYGDASLQEQAEAALLGNEDGDIVMIDVTHVADHDGAAVTQKLVTKAYNSRDLEQPSRFMRFHGIKAYARGGTMDVSYSTDLGRTWTLAESVTLSSLWAEHKIDFDVTGESLMLKFLNTAVSGKFSLRDLSIAILLRSNH